MNLSAESRKPVLTRAQEAALADRIKNGLDRIGARNELVMRNERLAYRLARGWVGANHKDFDDMFQEAMIGLMRAAELFDPSRGLKFSTYARWFIRLKVFRTLGKATVVRVPRREWAKGVRREESMSEFEGDIVQGDEPPDPADIAESIYEGLEVLDGAELEVIRERFELDGWDQGFSLRPGFGGNQAAADRLLRSALSKLRRDWLDRAA